MEKEEIERLSSLETKIDMHLEECSKQSDYTREVITDIHLKINDMREQLAISLYKQDEHFKQHKTHEENLFKVKLALFGTAIVSAFSLLLNLLI